MSNIAGEEGARSAGGASEPPQAWIWSQYRGELPADAPAAAPADPAPPTASAAGEAVAAAATAGADPAKKSGHSGLLVAAAILVIAGLTYFYSTRPVSGPAPRTPDETAAPAAPAPSAQPSEPAPPAAAPAAQEPPKAEAPASAPAGEKKAPGKKKKKSRRARDED